MNLNTNNLVIGNLTIVKANNFKAMIIGILLIVFVMASNTNGTAAFAQDGKNIIGCANTVKVTIFKLPKQTTDASSEVTLSNIGPSDDRGYGNISIPGIGSGHVLVNFHIGSIGEYKAEVSDIPGQTGESKSNYDMTEGVVCGQSIHPTASIDIPGIGSGSITITKVN
jgi:hypothetical protein